MTWKTIIGEVANQLPQFNDDLLINFKDREINKCADYIEGVFIEAVKAMPKSTCISYKGKEVVDPINRVRNAFSQKQDKNRFSINGSEWKLVNYWFNVPGADNDEMCVSLYIPYLVNRNLVINGTRYNFQLVIGDKLVHIPEGILIKVMRSPLKFWRKDTDRITITDIDGLGYAGHVITMLAHYGAYGKTHHPPLLLYLLAKYGLTKTADLFNVKGLIDVTPRCTYDDEVYTYFEIIPNKCYIKAARDELNTSIVFKRLVLSLHLILTKFKEDILSADFRFEDLFNTTFYESCLGKHIQGLDLMVGMARLQGQDHLASLDPFLDAVSKKNLEADLGIHVNNVYELFVYIFIHMDDWLANYQPNDLFEKKLYGIEHILKSAVQSIFDKVYTAVERRKDAKAKEIAKTVFRLRPDLLASMISAEGVNSSVSMYNDDTLFTELTDKIRQSRSSNTKSKASKAAKKDNIMYAKEYRFSASYVAIESILSVSTSNPCIAGKINAFAQIDENNTFSKARMPWFEQIEKLSDHLF